jgi:hypothetical protein
MSIWNEEKYETLSRLAARGNEKSTGSLAASVSTVTEPEDDQLCASLINRSLAASVTSDNPALEIYKSVFGFE